MDSHVETAQSCAVRSAWHDARGKNEFPARHAKAEQQEGHMGVRRLSQIAQEFGSFRHTILNVLIAEFLATDGAGQQLKLAFWFEGHNSEE